MVTAMSKIASNAMKTLLPASRVTSKSVLPAKSQAKRNFGTLIDKLPPRPSSSASNIDGAQHTSKRNVQYIASDPPLDKNGKALASPNHHIQMRLDQFEAEHLEERIGTPANLIGQNPTFDLIRKQSYKSDKASFTGRDGITNVVNGKIVEGNGGLDRPIAGATKTVQDRQATPTEMDNLANQMDALGTYSTIGNAPPRSDDPDPTGSLNAGENCVNFVKKHYNNGVAPQYKTGDTRGDFPHEALDDIRQSIEKRVADGEILEAPFRKMSPIQAESFLRYQRLAQAEESKVR